MERPSSGRPGRSLGSRKIRQSDVGEKEGLSDTTAAANRRRAWQRVVAATSKVVDREPHPERTNREDEEAIADAIREFRRNYA